MKFYLVLPLTFCVVLALGLTGCGGASSDKAASKAPPEAVHEEHASEGPHGGSLIELGNEEYHAELVHDDKAKTVTVYILDSAAKTSVPIDAVDVTINLKHEGLGKQFKLAAAADQNDTAGKSSRFASSMAELAEVLDGEGAEAELVVNINGKPYRGALEHGHEEGHEHGK